MYPISLSKIKASTEGTQNFSMPIVDGAENSYRIYYSSANNKFEVLPNKNKKEKISAFEAPFAVQVLEIVGGKTLPKSVKLARRFTLHLLL